VGTNIIVRQLLFSDLPGTYTSTCLYSNHRHFHLASTCYVGFPRFPIGGRFENLRAGMAIKIEWREIWKSFLPIRKPLKKKDDWQEEQVATVSRQRSVSSTNTSWWKPIKCLSWSISNCTWIRILELTEQQN